MRRRRAFQASAPLVRVWRNWQTHRSQKPVDGGSNPSARTSEPTARREEVRTIPKTRTTRIGFRDAPPTTGRPLRRGTWEQKRRGFTLASVAQRTQSTGLRTRAQRFESSRRLSKQARARSRRVSKCGRCRCGSAGDESGDIVGATPTGSIVLSGGLLLAHPRRGFPAAPALELAESPQLLLGRSFNAAHLPIIATPWPSGQARVCKARTRRFDSVRCLRPSQSKGGEDIDVECRSRPPL
jgi:hypothetical protein